MILEMKKKVSLINEGDGVKSDILYLLIPIMSYFLIWTSFSEVLKPFCYWGHEMVLKDENECYECRICDNKKEGEHWWCESCRDEPEDELNICLDCVSDKGNYEYVIFNEIVKCSIRFY